MVSLAMWRGVHRQSPRSGLPRLKHSRLKYGRCASQEKIEAIAKETYGAASVEYLPRAEKQIELYTKMGFAGLPICMAKTQYSFSADAAAKVSILRCLFSLFMGWAICVGPQIGFVGLPICMAEMQYSFSLMLLPR